LEVKFFKAENKIFTVFYSKTAHLP